MDVERLIFVVCVVSFTAVAAVCDTRTKRLPNVLTVSALAVALAYHLIAGALQSGLAGAGWGLLFAMGGFATGFGILFVLWIIGGGGGGDVKLMGALGAWLGAGATLNVFLVSTVFVAVGSLGLLFLETCGLKRRRKSQDGKRRKRPRQESPEQAAARKQERRLMPYGVPVALATWGVLAFPTLKILLAAT